MGLESERISQAVFIVSLWYAAFIPDDGYNAESISAREQPDFLLEQCVCIGGYGSCILWKPVFFSSGPGKTAGKSRFAVTGSYLSVP